MTFDFVLVQPLTAFTQFHLQGLGKPVLWFSGIVSYIFKKVTYLTNSNAGFIAETLSIYTLGHMIIVSNSHLYFISPEF